MNDQLNIPHNRVHLEDNVLKTERVGTDYVDQMTHELRTPLNVIIGLCQCLERDHESPLNETQRDTVGRMERNAHALLDSVNRLLESMRTANYK
jgi:two-component system sensor histidine kinase BarA